MSAEQMVADLQTKVGGIRGDVEKELQSMRATLRVLIEGQAQMYADICRLESEAPVGEDDYRALMDEWKKDTANLIEKILEGNVDEETNNSS